jgi:hypothetical protein
MLKLVYVNPNPVPASDLQEIADGPNSIAEIAPQKHSFREEVVASILPHFGTKTHLVGLSSYTMVAHDISHYLSCSLTLEVQPSDDESEFGDVICHFPVIQEEYLEALLWEDEVLINMVMRQFYLKILERLLVFCNNHNALKLIVHANAREAKKMGIYEQFAVHTQEIISHHGRTATLVIPMDTETQNKLIEYMAHVADAFREILEDDDPVVQQYAKFSAFGVS